MIHFRLYFLLAVLIFGIVVFFSFFDLLSSFFQQDEWQFFGADISALESNRPFLNTILPFGGQLTHFYPLATLFFLFEYLLFKVNFFPYALISVILHLVNGLLVYYLFFEASKKKLISFLATLLFLVNSISHQAVSWVLAAATTLPATTALLISLIFFIKYLEKIKNKFFLLSLFFLLISLLFKEIALSFIIFYLLVFLLLYLTNNKNFSLKKIKTPFVLLILFGGFYFILRLFFFFLSFRSPQPEIGDVSPAPLISYFYRVVTVPFKGFAQSIIPQKALLGIANKLIEIAYPQFLTNDGLVNQQISQSVGVDIVSFFLTFVVIILLLFVYWYLKKTKLQRLKMCLVFGVAFTFISFFPYIFIPGKAGYFSIFEPRNLYISTIGTSLLLVLFFYFLDNLFIKKIKFKNFILFLLTGSLLIFHIIVLRNDLDNLKKIGQLRKSLLTKVEKRYPHLNNKVMFLTLSDRSYYGMPAEERVLPVQSGFGRMLMVWYQDKEHFPSCLYQNQFLHDLLSEGYKFCDGRGFGYFRQYDKALKLIEKNEASIDDLIVYSWNGDSQNFTDVSKDIRKKIINDIKSNEF